MKILSIELGVCNTLINNLIPVNLDDLHAGHEGGDDLVAHEEAGAEAGEVGEGPGWLGNLPQVN